VKQKKNWRINVIIELVALLIKHWYVDFVNQTTTEVQGKGIYGNRYGVWHSAKHGLFTALIFFNSSQWYYGILVGVVDFTLHYHIDWVKMNYGNRDISDKKFWRDLGLDQLAHQLCYIAYVTYF